MIKVGVIGSGRWGKNHLRIYSELDCQLIALADVNPKEKNTASEYGILFKEDYKEMLPLVDAVSVVVPTTHHYHVVKDCLNAGKHVLVEKPTTLDHKSTKELIDLAKKKNLLLLPGYVFRYNSSVLALKEQIKKAGDIQYITARYIHSHVPPRKDSGVTFNLAIHIVDVLGQILERKPNKLFCKTLNYLSEKDDVSLISLDYGDFIASIEATCFHPIKKRDLWLVGSKRKLYVDMLRQELTIYEKEIGYDSVKEKPQYNVEIWKNEPLKDELKFFLETIEKDGPFPDSELYDTIKICELSLESAKTGKEKKL